MRRTVRTLSAAALAVGMSGLVGTPLAAAGGGCHAVVSIESGVTQVIADHACWNPVVARIGVGQTLTFVNDSGLDHTLGGPGPFGVEDFRIGATLKLTFPETGIYPYACTLHPQMSGAVVVGNPLGSAAPAAVAPAAAAPVDLSTSDDTSGSLTDSTAVRVGSGAAVAAVLGAGLLAVRRRRATLPLT